MAVLITESRSKIEFDTLGAIKVKYFNGDIDPIYCYARIYCIDKGFAVGVKVFETVEKASHRVSLSFTTDFQTALNIEFGNNTDLLAFKSVSADLHKLDAPAVSYISGDDNQGYYWGAEFFINQDLCSAIGLTAAAGNTFAAGLYIHKPSMAGHGCAFAEKNGYGNFIVVPY